MIHGCGGSVGVAIILAFQFHSVEALAGDCHRGPGTAVHTTWSGHDGGWGKMSSTILSQFFKGEYKRGISCLFVDMFTSSADCAGTRKIEEEDALTSRQPAKLFGGKYSRGWDGVITYDVIEGIPRISCNGTRRMKWIFGLECDGVWHLLGCAATTIDWWCWQKWGATA